MTTVPEDQNIETFRKLWEHPSGILASCLVVNSQPLGKRFIITSLVFLVLGGVQALLLRAQLTVSNNTLLGPDIYNQLFTMHGSTMMYLFAVPMLEGIALTVLPLMIGSRDVAFPRLAAFSYWTYVFGGILFYSSFLFRVVPDAGWFAYTPLSGPAFSGKGVDFWLLGLALVEIGGITAGIEIVVSILKLRAPGMSLGRMPLFAWTMLIAGLMIIFAFTTLFTATLLLEADRTFGTRFFDTLNGGNSLLWQHLFWFFGHPEVYIMFIPATGIVSMIVATSAKREIVGYSLVVTAIIVTGFVSFGLWVHHMYTTGMPELAMAFFTAASLMIGIASGIQVFAWIATLWGTKPKLTPPLLYVCGFLFIFVLGGFTGVMLAVVPFDLQVHDTFFIVAHFHYVLIGGVVFPILGGLHYWYPKLTGRMLSEPLARFAFWMNFVGFNATFFPMHIMGFLGMPRRVYTYSESLGIDGYNIVSTIGAAAMAIGMLVFLYNGLTSLKRGQRAGRNPWNSGTLEWLTESPAPNYGFAYPPNASVPNPLWSSGEPEMPTATSIERIQKALHWKPSGWRAIVVTDAVRGSPEAIQAISGPSVIPVATAIAVTITFIGVLGKWHLLTVGSLLVSTIIVMYWLWPNGDRLKEIAQCSVVQDTGLPVFTADHRSVAWWAMLGFQAVIGTVFAVLAFAYFFLALLANDWPPPSITPPAGDHATIATALMPVCLFAVWMGRNRGRHGIRANGFLGLALTLGIASAALYITEIIRFPFTPSDHAYASVHWIASLAVLMSVGVGIAFIGGLILLEQRSAVEREWAALPRELMLVQWVGAVAIALFVYGVLYISPKFITFG